nr:MAG TPA: hypothetical protein [Caudoviricetes sp.]
MFYITFNSSHTNILIIKILSQTHINMVLII